MERRQRTGLYESQRKQLRNKIRVPLAVYLDVLRKNRNFLKKAVFF